MLHLAQPRAPPRNHHGRRPPATTKPSLAELALKMEPAHSNEAPLPLNFISNRCNEKRPNWLLSSLAPAAAYLPFRHRPLPLSLPPASRSPSPSQSRTRATLGQLRAVPAAAGELLAPPLPDCAGKNNEPEEDVDGKGWLCSPRVEWSDHIAKSSRK